MCYLNRRLGSRYSGGVRTLFLVAALGLTVGPARAQDDSAVELVTRPSVPTRDGERTAVSLSVVPRAGHRLSADGPLVIRLTTHDARTPRLIYHRADAVDARADVPRFEIPVVVEKAASASIEARCLVWLCKDDQCRPVELSAKLLGH
jgi:hypothetical protein